MSKVLLGSNKTVFQNVNFGSEALSEILSGAEILYKAVKSTMGPSGHNVVIENGVTAPLITKDGVTVAKSINLKKKLPGIGAELLKEIASKTNELAGDGPQPLTAKILTPTGWTTMDKLKLNDEICGKNNTIQKVVGIFPKGKKEICKVKTSDGRVVECCEDHLWQVTTSYGKEKILTVKQMLELGITKTNSKGDIRYRFHIPNTSVEFKQENHLPIDPYTLGVLIGDGSLSVKHDIEISVELKESYILDQLVLPSGHQLRNRIYKNKNHIKSTITKGKNFKVLLNDLKLLGCKSENKFIPKQYLYASLENRKKLLDGLIDTDGYINNRGLLEFCTISEQLKNDFVELCRSLGKQMYVKKHIRKSGDGSYGKNPIYRISELKGYQNGLKITSIEKTGVFVDMQCIKVSNPDHLYITDDYTLTHNTTTATVLGYTMLAHGTKMIATGRSSIGIKRGMEFATDVVIKWLKENAIQVRNNEDIISVGTISANGDRQIGELLCEAIGKVGQDGIITIEPAKSVQTQLEVVQGMQMDTGYVSPYFVTNQEKLTCELQEPLVLITDKKLSVLQDILPALELANQSNQPLLIIGDQVDGEVLHTLIVNKMKGVLFSCAVTAPSYGENRSDILQDIALLTGGIVFDSSTGVSLKDISMEHFGKCEKVIVSRNSTTFVGKDDEDRKAKIAERVATIRKLLDNEKTLDDLRRNNLKKRLAKLAGGIAVIKVGGATEVEIMEKKDRVEDALNATVAAVQEGILPGGGTALFYAAESLKKTLEGYRNIMTEDEYAGAMVIYETCRQPLKVIVENTGKSADVVMDHLQKLKQHVPEDPTPFQSDLLHLSINNRLGYDAHKHEHCDLIERGIIDPLKVERYALLHACSVTSLLLTSNAIVTNEDVGEEK